MLELVRFENIRAAYALADYLNVQGIDCRVQADGSGAIILLAQESDLPRAREELRDFLDNPMDKKYLSASWEQASGEPGARPEIEKFYQSASKGSPGRWRQTGLFTKLVIGICAVVFLITAFGSDPKMVRYFFFFNYVGQMYDLSQVYRWITPVFLHFGILHFAFNLLWWWEIGSIIERYQGSRRLLLIFMVLAIVPNFVQFLAAGNRFGGLSGVVYGVLGYVWIYGRLRRDHPFQLRPAIIYMMVGWMLIGFSGALDNVVGPMANEAHLAGLVSGVLLALMYASGDSFKRASRKNG
ncbi:MAG: rhomboid family intramembrane serine protease GlpG [Ketobacteraceae bacterium]|nr:rhomboid family intramembrane serine protease GlpG [Ketobacteraceae bacterium]